MSSEKILKDYSTKIFSLFDFPEETFTLQKGEEDTFEIKIKESEESGFLIGYHGQTLESIQFILSLILFYQEKKWSRVFLEIGDYRERKQKMLEEMAEKTAEKAIFLEEPVPMSPMSAGERRLVHMFLKEREDVTTESSGDGRERHITITPQVHKEKK